MKVLTFYIDFIYTPGSDGHGPRFLTGGPGAAPGGVASKNGWVYQGLLIPLGAHARTGGIQIP